MDDAERINAISTWEQSPPGIGVRGLSQLSSKLSGVVKQAIPTAAIEAALDGANRLAVKSGATRSLLKMAEATSVDELRSRPLEQNEQLANSVRRSAMAMAAGTGAATGWGGAALMAADVPALITLCLRTIHRTGMAYGYDCSPADRQALLIALFALASANTLDEKRTAIDALRGLDPLQPLATEVLGGMAWREGVERAAEREFAKEAVAFSIANLARQIGVNLAQRKAAAAIPVLGAVVGGSVNAWTVHDLARTSQFAFQAWRLGHWGRDAPALALSGPGANNALPAPPTD